MVAYGYHRNMNDLLLFLPPFPSSRPPPLRPRITRAISGVNKLIDFTRKSTSFYIVILKVTRVLNLVSTPCLHSILNPQPLFLMTNFRCLKYFLLQQFPFFIKISADTIFVRVFLGKMSNQEKPKPQDCP